MKHTRLGVGVGVVLGFAVILGGWTGLVWVLLFGGLGGVVGAHLDGRIDLGAVVRGIGGRD